MKTTVARQRLPLARLLAAALAALGACLAPAGGGENAQTPIINLFEGESASRPTVRIISDQHGFTEGRSVSLARDAGGRTRSAVFKIDGADFGVEELASMDIVLEASPETNDLIPREDRSVSVQELRDCLKMFFAVYSSVGDINGTDLLIYSGDDVLASFDKAGTWDFRVEDRSSWFTLGGWATLDVNHRRILTHNRTVLAKNITPLSLMQAGVEKYLASGGGYHRIALAETQNSHIEAARLMDTHKRLVQEGAWMVATGLKGYVTLVGFTSAGGLMLGVNDLTEGEYLSAAMSLVPFLGRAGKAAYLKIPDGTLPFSPEMTKTLWAIKKYDYMARAMTAGHAAQLLSLLGDCSQAQKGLIARALFCFPAGTPVLTERGPTPIESLREGDRVLAFDELTRTNGWRSIASPVRSPATELTELRLSADGAEETLRSTPDHPFYALRTDDRGAETWRWYLAGELRAGDLIWRLSGTPAEVVEGWTLAEAAEVYSFRVDGLYTYYVGELGLLVHNAKCYSQLLKQMERALSKRITSMEFFMGSYTDRGEELLKAAYARTTSGMVSGSKKSLSNAWRRMARNHHEIIPCNKLEDIVLNSTETDFRRNMVIANKMRIDLARFPMHNNPDFASEMGNFHIATNQAFEKSFVGGRIDVECFRREMSKKNGPLSILGDTEAVKAIKRIMKKVADAHK